MNKENSVKNDAANAADMPGAIVNIGCVAAAEAAVLFDTSPAPIGSTVHNALIDAATLLRQIVNGGVEIGVKNAPAVLAKLDVASAGLAAAALKSNRQQPAKALTDEQRDKLLLQPLQRIALNIYGDTPAQVIAGEATEKYRELIARDAGERAGVPRGDGVVLSAAAFEEIAEGWDECQYDTVGDIGAALRRDFARLATAGVGGLALSAAACEEIAKSWDECRYDMVDDIGGALRHDFAARALPAAGGVAPLHDAPPVAGGRKQRPT